MISHEDAERLAVAEAARLAVVRLTGHRNARLVSADLEPGRAVARLLLVSGGRLTVELIRQFGRWVPVAVTEES
jgi:hypothetical protein